MKGMEKAKEIQSANALIQANVHHTRLQTSNKTTDLIHAGRMIERLGEKCFAKNQFHTFHRNNRIPFLHITFSHK